MDIPIHRWTPLFWTTRYEIFRYLDEQSWRFNNRHVKDGDRFIALMKCVTGLRLTYEQLVDRVQPAEG